ncbi:MAG: carbon-nitrogen hydrolase family protein, partial [Acidimicrobiia bacterium]|nr:carbon-nitrogen hydrolase family protein [Acidimicrobiia bacterium]
PEGVMRDFRPRVDLASIAEPLDGEFVAGLSDQARRLSLWILAGMWEKVDGESRVSNTTVVIGPDGDLVDCYRKIHLFDSFGFAESERVVPGPISPTVIDVDGLRVGVMTCYDLRFPELARALVADGAQAIAMGAGWIAGPGKLAQWKTLLKARAIENTVFMVAAGIVGGGYTGHSAILDPFGEPIAELEDEQAVAVGDLDKGALDEARSLVPSLRHRRM